MISPSCDIADTRCSFDGSLNGQMKTPSCGKSIEGVLTGFARTVNDAGVQTELIVTRGL